MVGYAKLDGCVNTAMLRVVVVDEPARLLAVMVYTVESEATVGVPEMTPVPTDTLLIPVSIDKPVGSAGLIE